MLKRYRYRAYPTPGQQAAAARLFGCTRVAWNDALAAREQARREGTKIPSMGDLDKAMNAAKKTDERAWLTEVSSTPLQQSLRDLDKAYNAFFKNLKAKKKRRVGAPKFKKRNARQSARFTRATRFKVAETNHGVAHVRLPKIGRVRYAMSRPLPSDPSSVTLIQEADGRYYVSFVVDVPDSASLPPVGRVAGVDVGLTHLATITYSDGTREKIDNPRWLRAKERKLARAQRELSRKKRGSANRQKARVKVATLHRKVRETRADHHQKLALRLIRENQTVAVEGLSVAGLARTRMAKSVQDAAWSNLTRLMHEKADQYGRTVEVISQWEPTSQTCSVCGAPGGKKPLSVRDWKCQSCGTHLDRDFNAAVNIMVAAGLAETLNARGGDVRHRLAGADPVEAGTRRKDLTHVG